MGLLIDMIDVGQGDSFLLTIDYPLGEAYVLIDAGLQKAGPKVLKYLEIYAPSGLDMVIATHLDQDHIGGLATVLEHTKFKNNAWFVMNVPPLIKDHWTPVRDTLEKYKGLVSFTKLVDAVDAVKTLSALANKKGLTQTDALRGRSWNCGDVSLNVLNPTPQRLAAAWEESKLDDYVKGGWEPYVVSLLESVAAAPDTSAENDSSIVIEIAVKRVPWALMTSDAGAAVLKEVTNKKSYSFLKVPHHGSETGLDEELIKQIRPRNAVIPVSENPHGHPDGHILDLLKSVGATTYCSSKTDNCRSSCTFNGGNISFPFDRAGHPGWTTVDSTKCKNNT